MTNGPWDSLLKDVDRAEGWATSVSGFGGDTIDGFPVILLVSLAQGVRNLHAWVEWYENRRKEGHVYQIRAGTGIDVTDNVLAGDLDYIKLWHKVGTKNENVP